MEIQYTLHGKRLSLIARLVIKIMQQNYNYSNYNNDLQAGEEIYKNYFT